MIRKVYVGVCVESLVDEMVTWSPGLALCVFWSVRTILCQFFPQFGSPASELVEGPRGFVSVWSSLGILLWFVNLRPAYSGPKSITM